MLGNAEKNPFGLTETLKTDRKYPTMRIGYYVLNKFHFWIPESDEKYI